MYRGKQLGIIPRFVGHSSQMFLSSFQRHSLTSFRLEEMLKNLRINKKSFYMANEMTVAAILQSVEIFSQRYFGKINRNDKFYAALALILSVGNSD